MSGWPTPRTPGWATPTTRLCSPASSKVQTRSLATRTQRTARLRRGVRLIPVGKAAVGEFVSNEVYAREPGGELGKVARVDRVGERVFAIEDIGARLLELLLGAPAPLDRDDGVVGSVADRDRR